MPICPGANLSFKPSADLSCTPPRDGAYGYVPLNITPRAPSRTPRLNNIQIYIYRYIATQPQTPRDSASGDVQHI